jgi:TolB protein
MKKLRSLSILKNWTIIKCGAHKWASHKWGPMLGFLLIAQIFLPNLGFSRMYIDINSPSLQRINIAIPDFINYSPLIQYPELSSALPAVVSNDLFMSGYFMPMDKDAFLDETGQNLEDVHFKNWTVIGAELLLRGGYTAVGGSLEVEIILFDVLWSRQIMRRRFLGKIDDHRRLMHRVGNEIIFALTGYQGMFLSKLAFVSTETGNKEIYMSDYDGHNARRLTSDKNIALFPRLSPKGDKILYSSFKDDGAKLYLKDIQSGKVMRISDRDGLNIGAAWEPDGKTIALTLSNEGNPDIYAIDLNGKILSRLVSHWGIDISPTFSPDGKKMAYVSNKSGSPQIYVHDLVENTVERITFFERNYNTAPVWSKLNRIAFSGLKGDAIDIYTIDPDGSNLQQLTVNQGKNEEPCWSPDGRYIVFSSTRSGKYQLYIMNADGRNQQRITNGKGEQTSPSWAP